MSAADLAVAVHRHLGGEDQVGALAGHGFTLADLERALRLATTPLVDQEAAEARVGQLLVALRAPGVSVERVEVRSVVSDETPAERSQRMESAGFFDAVTYRPKRELPRAVDAEAYARGQAAFLALLAGDLQVAP